MIVLLCGPSAPECSDLSFALSLASLLFFPFSILVLLYKQKLAKLSNHFQ